MESTILLVVTALLFLILVALFFGYREVTGMGLRIKRLEMDFKAILNRPPQWVHSPTPLVAPQGGFSEAVAPPADDDVVYFNDDEVLVEDASSYSLEEGEVDEDETESCHSSPNLEDDLDDTPLVAEVDIPPPSYPSEEPVTEPAEEEDFEIEPVPKKSSGKPDESARDFDVDFEMISPKDGQTYRVKEDKAGRKRWVKA